MIDRYATLRLLVDGLVPTKYVVYDLVDDQFYSNGVFLSISIRKAFVINVDYISEKIAENSGFKNFVIMQLDQYADVIDSLATLIEDKSRLLFVPVSYVETDANPNFVNAIMWNEVF